MECGSFGSGCFIIGHPKLFWKCMHWWCGQPCPTLKPPQAPCLVWCAQSALFLKAICSPPEWLECPISSGAVNPPLYMSSGVGCCGVSPRMACTLVVQNRVQWSVSEDILTSGCCEACLQFTVAATPPGQANVGLLTPRNFYGRTFSGA